MSSAVSSSQVTTSTPILVTTPSSETKPFGEHKRDDSSDDQRQQLNKQTKTYTRGNSNKNKQLTRSHAMKESASPPRTPNSHSPNDMKSPSPTAAALNSTDSDSGANTSTTTTAVTTSSSSSLLLTAPTFILPQPESSSVGGKSQLDIEFPKLTPPKTKVGWNSSNSGQPQQQRNRKSVSSDTSSNNNSLCEDTNESHVNDKQQQQPKTGSQSISVTTACTQQQQQSSPSSSPSVSECANQSELFNHDERVIISPSRAQCKSPNLSSSSHNNNINNNNISNSGNNNNSNSNNYNNTSTGTKSATPSYPINIKNKPPLKNMGSSSSCEGGNTSSGFISRDSSSEQFVDQNGIDLVQFFKETLNKNAKDRNMLMKIERELLQLAVDQTGRTFVKFPPMSSYNRMLVHRTAAYFGMDHNVDATQQCVIASTTKETRIPDIRFKTLIRDTFSEEPRKSILKRETHSFEDYRQGGLLSVQRSILNRKAKSFEERDEEYEKEWQWIHHNSVGGGGSEISSKVKVPIRLMKIHSSSMDGRYIDKAPVSKSHSFGGYGGPNVQLMRDDSITSSKSAGPRLHKQDSTTSTTWRLSPSSSGYKTQSLRSVTPSPTGGYGSDTPEPSNAPESTRGVVWAVTDLASVPKGSLIIDPQTLQPILNQDGSLYHFDPSNPPTTTTTTSSGSRYGSARKKADRPKLLNNNLNYNNNNNNNNNMSSSNKPNNIRDHTNSGSTDNEKSTTLLSSGKHVASKFNNNQMSHNNINNEIDDDDEGEEDEEDIDDDENDPTDMLPLDVLSPKNQCESLVNEDDCKTKDDICENKSSQCELKNQPSHLNTEELVSPKQKNQSTSPNLPLNDTMTINEEEVEESVTPTSSIQPIIEEDASVDSKKDEITSATETPPVQEIRFQANPYTNTATVAASTTPSMPPTVLSYAPAAPFATAPIETAGTIYHTGENEVPSCWVPIFDQGARGDPNLTVLPYNNGPTIYQSPVVYSTEQFTNPPAIAAGQVTQYPISAYPAMGYAATTYPVNGAPYQNIWPQPMTYFLPPSATPAPAQVLVPPAAPQTPNATMIQSASNNSHNPSTNATGGRRNSPQNNSNNSNGNGVSSGAQTAVATAVPLQTFPSSVPFSLATSETTSASGPTLYAIPPSMYPANMLPAYSPATGFYQPMPHPQANTTIISSVIPHSNAHHPGTVPSTPHSFQATTASGEVLTHFPFNQQPPNIVNNNTASTPQSAPSTPLSLTTMPPNFKNQPIFTTQPLIAATPVHIAHTYDNDKKNNSSNNNNNPPKKFNCGGNGILSTPPAFSHSNATKSSNNPRHQQQQQQPLGGYQSSTSLASGNGNKKNMHSNCNNLINSTSNSHSDDANSLSNSNMSSSNYSSSNRVKNSSNRDQNSSSTASGTGGSYQPKSSYKQSYNSNSNSPNSNDNSESTNNNNNGSKFQPRGPSRIPPLDLKRNNSNSGSNVVMNHHTRSTPSTNSTESNNSPNSITSYDHSRGSNSYHHYSAQQQSHQPSHHHTQSSHHQHHPPQPSYQSSGGTHFYRGGSAGAVNTHHSANSGGNSTESPSIQTCFPFNVHSQNAGTSTPLLDSCHPQTLIGYNNPMAAGMYVKFGQAFTFANPLPNNRKSPSNDIRTPLTPLAAGVYSTTTMMLPGGPRPINSRTVQNNHHYKGNRTQQR
ncbi:hypothetical protein PVAND_008325 [Polypedilum vanderplanki]|uniref:Uncharacterized protein n=1 Tax=Polypedilum vanderplanki TaxID=319348 RepID=A0A9J6C9E8_POLVA|nr:hypothetical protein PVAND_008325 [Polypedilum vanderplanki]